MTYRTLFSLAALCWIVLQYGCTKQDLTPEALIGRWEVTRFATPGGKSAHAPIPYMVEFSTDGAFSLRLEVNSCRGTYRTPSHGAIVLEDLGRTDVCCDSPFAERLAQAFAGVEHYQLRGGTLHLEGAGSIRLRRF